MRKDIKALLVEERYGALDALRLALGAHSIEVSLAGNCALAALALWSDSPPHLVFTEINLADGNWADILTLAAKASAPVNVIVVAPHVDVGFYVEAIERGAFDFIVPPLSEMELLHVVRNAAEDALSRRRKHAAGPIPDSLAGAPDPNNIENEHAVASAED
jgi:two-component system C4-dicarboxylate transport response regulator DctD